MYEKCEPPEGAHSWKLISEALAPSAPGTIDREDGA